MVPSSVQMLDSVADPRPTSSRVHKEVKSFLSWKDDWSPIYSVKQFSHEILSYCRRAKRWVQISLVLANYTAIWGENGPAESPLSSAGTASAIYLLGAGTQPLPRPLKISSGLLPAPQRAVSLTFSFSGQENEQRPTSHIFKLFEVIWLVFLQKFNVETKSQHYLNVWHFKIKF